MFSRSFFSVKIKHSAMLDEKYKAPFPHLEKKKYFLLYHHALSVKNKYFFDAIICEPTHRVPCQSELCLNFWIIITNLPWLPPDNPPGPFFNIKVRDTFCFTLCILFYKPCVAKDVFNIFMFFFALLSMKGNLNKSLAS